MDDQTPAKPDFSAQVSKAELDDLYMTWVYETRSEFERRGATWFRVSHNDEHGLLLMDGWKKRPAVQAEPFFFLTPA